MNAIDRARDLMIAVQFMSDKEAAIRVAAEAIRAAEADARREALEEAAKLIERGGPIDPSCPWRIEKLELRPTDSLIDKMAAWIRALASQKGTK